MEKRKEVVLQSKTLSVKGILYDSPTATKLWDALPIKSVAHRWGDEVYFSTQITTELEDNATDVVPPGTICFWVEGNSVAIPFGRTPVSKGNECRLITEVNIIGKITDDPTLLDNIHEGDEIELKATES
ncbi:MAG: cyclophilin-like fold protein [Candidatus Hydrogenedentes bacterium]|nr:cyclophilin-like fold protein [Candidatus Hydrogenedentota bacterium]